MFVMFLLEDFLVQSLLEFRCEVTILTGFSKLSDLNSFCVSDVSNTDLNKGDGLAGILFS